MVLVAPKRNMVQKLAQPERNTKVQLRHQPTNTEYRFLLKYSHRQSFFLRSRARLIVREKQGINCVASHAVVANSHEKRSDRNWIRKRATSTSKLLHVHFTIACK